MMDKISSELREKINKLVEKALDTLIEQVSKGNAIEEIIKMLIIEKIANTISPLIHKPVMKKLAHEAIRIAVDAIWDKNKEKISERIKNLKA